MAGSGMKMAELTKASGISTATIKFYLREGLLHAGTPTAPNQALYDESHLRRLRLIRALRNVVGVSIASIREAMVVLDDRQPQDLREVIRLIATALGATTGPRPEETPERTRAANDIDAFLARAGLALRKESGPRDTLIGALLAYREIDPLTPTDVFEVYAEALRGLAAWEVALVFPPDGDGERRKQPDRVDLMEAIIYGTLLLEPVILALRQLLEEKFVVEGVRQEDLPDWAAKFAPPTAWPITP